MDLRLWWVQVRGHMQKYEEHENLSNIMQIQLKALLTKITYKAVIRKMEGFFQIPLELATDTNSNSIKTGR